MIEYGAFSWGDGGGGGGIGSLSNHIICYRVVKYCFHLVEIKIKKLIFSM